LIKCKLLTKNPSAHSFEPTDVLSVNADYKSSLFRNKIPVMVSKEKKDKEGAKVQEKVEDFRRYEIEAAIIKVMKARRTIDNQTLQQETVKLLITKFNPDAAQIKVRIEQLIVRGFIERDESDKRIFKYIA
jgi:cullin 3